MKHLSVLSTLIVGMILLLSNGAGESKGKPAPPPLADPALAWVAPGSYSTASKLYVSNVDGSNAVVVYTAAENAIFNYPSWSPDGRSLAFRPRAGSADIMAIDVEIVNGVPTGTNLRTLVTQTDCGGNCGPPQWSPSGNWIATTNQDSIVIFPSTCPDDPSCTITTLYTSAAGYHPSYPMWSPTEDRIAFHDSEWGLRILNVTTGSVQGVSNPFLLVCTDWARGSDRLACVDGAGQLAVLNLDDQENPEFYPVTMSGWSPSWSPCNDEIVFQADRRGLQIITLATGDVRNVTKGYAITPDWRRGTCQP